MFATRPFRNGLIALAVALAGPASALSGDEPKGEPSLLENDPKGWIDMLTGAGPELEGWVRGPIPGTAELPEKSPWSFDKATSSLICDGSNSHEWLRLDQVLTDYVLHVEWRFEKVAGKKGYNSGVYVRTSSDQKLWHQAQCGDGSGGYLFGETMSNYASKPFDLSKEVRDRRVKPAGEWNTYELTCRGREVTLWVNGAVTCVMKPCPVPRGYIGVESEGYRIEFRNIRVKML
ncbi:hypothetical protein OJF2_57630 [Aquisphaera giovannonii]|uniref:3-keto-alpha-glucoside-1,2-lyase/3-keto-2-hydroxy-glucal hydratase domain-containing protein n=1 Tax=Aquisphaera giovannonii TaxID=406548 RepID=A0A5B9W9B1_9BACT|nr:DUF1080 domain-containing protein [Aquisphaera giovannonii]QEH37176.1 hypothetical protein OJF2_57630 [Aquisphaera giovannonii]